MSPAVQLRFENQLGYSREGWPTIKLYCEPYQHVQVGDVLHGLATRKVTEQWGENFPDACRDGMVVAALRVTARVWGVDYGVLCGTTSPSQCALLTLWVEATGDMLNSPGCGDYVSRHKLKLRS